MSFSRWFQQNKKLVGIGGAATTVGAGLWWYERRHLKDTEPAILQKGLHKQEFGSQVAVDFDKGEKISSGDSNKSESVTKHPTKRYQDAIESEIRKLSLSPELADKVREYIEKDVYVTSEDDLPIASKMLEDREESIAYHAKRSVDHATNKIANETLQRTKSNVTEGVKQKAHGMKESLIEEKEKLKTMVKNKKPLEQLKGKRDLLVGAVETRAKDILGYTSPPTENNSQEITNNIPLTQSQTGIKEESTDLNLEPGQTQDVPHDVLGRRITEHNQRIDFIEENIPASQTFTDAVKSAKDKAKDLEHKVEGDLAQGKEYFTEKAKEARNVLDEKMHKLSGGVNELGNKLDVEHNIKVDIIEYHGEDIPEIVKRKAKELKNATIKTVSTTQEKLGELTQEVKETAVEPIVNKYNESKESLLEKAKDAKDQAVKEKEFNEKLYGSKKEQVERFAEEVKHEVKETADNTLKKMEELAVKKLKNTAISTVHVAQEATDPVLSTYERLKEYMYQRAKHARDTAATLKHERLQKEARHTTKEKGELFDSSATVDEVINNP